MYRITTLGERVLRIWMGVIKDEHDGLGEVLRRYQATGTTDAVLAEVEGGWATALSSGWSAVSSTSVGRRRLVPVPPWAESEAARRAGRHPAPRHADRPGDPGPRRFRLIPDRSVVLIEVRSTVGPLSFGAIGVSGWIEAALIGGLVQRTTRRGAGSPST